MNTDEQITQASLEFELKVARELTEQFEKSGQYKYAAKMFGEQMRIMQQLSESYPEWNKP